MTELMMKMTSWLVAAMVLGFVVAWLLSRIIYKKRQDNKENAFSAVILERNNIIDKLEKSFRDKRKIFEEVSNDLKNSQEALAEKTSLLTTLQNRVDNSNENTSLVLKEKNNLLAIKIQKLEEDDIKRVGELEGFEEILLLAEKKVEENEKSYQEVLKSLDEDIEHLTLENEKNKTNIKFYKKNIKAFEEDLKLYKSDSLDSEFIISKDQFLKIEEQLVIYQEEIKSLENVNSELLLKAAKSFTGLQEDSVLENKTFSELGKERDDGAMVKAFRETYKKITSS